MYGAFVGRRRELAELGRRRGEAVAGRGGVVLVVGEAGIGKSTLVEQLIGESVADGVPVLVGRAVPDEGVPAFWPWMRLLNPPGGAVHSLDLELLAGRHAPFDPGPAARFEMIDRTARALVEAAADKGLLVALEDLQWADEASLQLLRYLASESSDSRLLLVGTFRADGAPPLLSEVTGLGGVRLLRLMPLDVPEVASYLSTVGGGDLHPSWPAMVHRYSGGNALFLRELARVLVAERLLAVPAEGLPVPVELRRLVSQRFAGLSESCRLLLAGCAVYGEVVDIGVLEAAPGPVAEAVAAGVLVEDVAAPGRLRWSHALIRAAYYEDMPRGERLAWHRRLAEALATSQGEGRAAARHYLRVAVDQPSRRAAVAACGRAAKEAADVLAFDDAGYWHRQALSLIEDDSERCQTLLALAEAAFRSGQVAEALDWCLAAADLAERLDRLDLLAHAAIVVQGIGGPHATPVAQLCVRASGRLGEENSGRHARVLAQHAIAMAINDIADAGPVSRRALEMAERSGEADALIDAVHARHQVVGGPDGVAERLHLGKRLREIAEIQNRPLAALWGHTWRIDAAFQLGAIPTVNSELVGLGGLADRLGWPLAQWHVLRSRASLALLAGRLDEAEQLAGDFREVATRTQDLSAQGAFFVFQSVLWRRTGRPREIQEVLASLPESYIALTERIPILMAVNAMLHLEGGDPDRAAVLFEGLRASIGALPINQRWTTIVTSTGELAAALGDRDTAALCYRLLLPYGGYYDNQAAACNGAVARTLGILAATTDRFDDADRHLSTAATMERRIAALPHLALTQLAHARTLLSRGATGDRTRALDLAEQAALTARRLGMAPAARTAARLADELTGVRGGPTALTKREREITALVAAGLANREIAERLVVSERTVETHVSNVLGKLGLANRTQLTAWALRAGIRA